MPTPSSLEHWYLETVSGRRRGLLPGLTRALLTVVSWGYGLGVGVRELVYAWGLIRPLRVPARVVSVGNLTMGGTGKTPAVIALAEQHRASERVAILIRGHGGERLEGVNVVHDGKRALLPVSVAGDEAVLLARRLGDIPVLAGKDRRLTAQAAVDRFGATLLILDDGFQYRRLAVDHQIVLVDATQPWGLGGLFPAGTRRDPLAAFARADEVWLTRCDHPAAHDLDAVETRLRRLAPRATLRRTRHAPRRLVGPEGPLPLERLAGQPVTALAGIGQPQAFAATLRELGAEVVAEAFFADHHPYTADELALVAAQAAGRVVVSTEKDQLRLDAWPTDGAPLWVLGVEIEDYRL